MTTISTRGAHLFDSPFRKYIPLANAAKKRGVQVHHLNIGQPDLPSPMVPFEAVGRIEAEYVPYCSADGISELIDTAQAFYRQHGLNLTNQDILVTTGASEAILMTLIACCDPGDEILIPQPTYANYIGFCEVAGVTPVGITSTIEDGFCIPPVDQFNQKISPKTKAILLSNPSNPTGKMYSQREILALCELAIQNNLFLIVDEAYRDFIYTGEPFYSILEVVHAADNVIMIDSISKRYNACGARIGFLISRNHQMLEIARKQARLRLSSPYFEQVFASAALQTEMAYYEKTNKEYQSRRNVVATYLAQMEDVTFHMPEGAFYFFVKLPVSNSEDFCKWLLTDFNHNGETVMLAHGNAFYIDDHLGHDEVRIAYVLREEKLTKAMECFQKALIEYKELKALTV